MARKQWQISAEARRKEAQRERDKRARQRKRDADRKARKVDEHNSKVNRLASKGREQLERERRDGFAEIDKFEAEMAKDPIGTLGLAFDPVRRVIVQDPVDLRGRSIEVVRGTENCLNHPPEAAGETWHVRVVDALVAPFGFVLAIEITNRDPTWSPSLSWFRKSSPKESACFLSDPTHGQYAYPTASTLGGKVLAGVPRTELVVFEPLRAPTDTLSFHLHDVKLTQRGPRVSVDVALPIRALREHLVQVSTTPAAAAELRRLLDAEVDEALQEVERMVSGVRLGRPRAGCGCLPALVLALVLTGTTVAAAFAQGF